jgi:hypothetical protein
MTQAQGDSRLVHKPPLRRDLFSVCVLILWLCGFCPAATAQVTATDIEAWDKEISGVELPKEAIGVFSELIRVNEHLEALAKATG